MIIQNYLNQKNLINLIKILLRILIKKKKLFNFNYSFLIDRKILLKRKLIVYNNRKENIQKPKDFWKKNKIADLVDLVMNSGHYFRIDTKFYR